ncbi:MAG: FAD-dependent oxidoreductase [Euryarchaeota archaeon]|nr:FAD-dependent oxidoreductase [Euryarchaeota archaeon]
MEEKDLIIIGGGPAGLSAGIYAVRNRLKTLVLEQALPGGLIAEASLVENYPGFLEIKGMELAEIFRKHAEKIGVEIKQFEEVLQIEKNEIFKVKTNNSEYLAKAVIIATGERHAELNVPGEAELKGKGVSYCATCDAPLFKNKKAVVVGNGRAAVMSALLLADIASEVKLIVKEKKIISEEVLKEKLKNSRANVLLSTEVREIFGDSVVKGIKVYDREKKQEYNIDADGVFVYAFVWKKPNVGFLKNLNVGLDDRGHIITNERQETNVKGLFAAGDVTSFPVKQVVVAAAQGCIAALSAYEHIKGLRGEA